MYWKAEEHEKPKGSVIGEVPFGFILGTDGKTLVKSPREQEAIRLIKYFAALKYSYRKIAEELNKRKIPTKKHGKWYHKQIAEILRRAVWFQNLLNFQKERKHGHE